MIGLRRQCLCLLLALPFGAGCDDTRLHAVTTQFDLFHPEDAARADTFVQKAAAKVDILWVVDNSPSMLAEQNNLANNFSSFMTFIVDSEVDYQVGVISSDMDLADHQGKLLGATKIIQPGPDAQAQFAVNVKVGTAGAGNEQGLAAATAALSEPLLSGANAGFLRSDAALALIFVSDENDNSVGNVSYFQRVIGQIKGVGNEKRVITAAIAGPKPSAEMPEGGCRDPVTNEVVARYSERYLALVESLGGKTVSICSSNFAETLKDLGLTVAGLSRKFTLSDTQPEDASIEVKVDGVLIPDDRDNGFTYENGSIFFNGVYVPGPGSSIEVSYIHPQREFVLTHAPAYEEENPGAKIAVTVYPPESASCTTNQECTQGVSCGLAGKCGGAPIPYSFSDGWVLETQTVGGRKRYVVAFERNYVPSGGSILQVVYPCYDGCK